MKNLIIIIIFIPAVALSQKNKGYGMFGGTGFLSEKFDNIGGITAGAGMSSGDHVTLGIGADFFPFSKQVIKFVQPYGDIRVFFASLDKPISPYIALQPGLTLCNKTVSGIRTTGSFAFNALVGIRGIPTTKNPIGVFLAMGYSNISFNTEYRGQSVRTKYGGVKVSGGLSF